MIYEIRTYRLEPGSLNEVIKRFGEAYEYRRKVSELAAFWYTDIGQLNQIIHVWPYESLAHRTEVRAEASSIKQWPPDIKDFQKDMISEIFNPCPFTPEIKPGKVGPVFEYRSYIIKPGTAGALNERWAKALPAREKVSPVLFAAHSELGPINKFIHIWPYDSLDHRHQVRTETREKKIWPPPGGQGGLVDQKNKIVFAAPFSPVQ